MESKNFNDTFLETLLFSNYFQDFNETGFNNKTSVISGYERDETLAKFEIAIQATIFVLNIFGNTCVITALGVKPKKLSRMHHFILHLSISDLIVAFFNTLPQLIWDITYRFEGIDFLCRFVKFSQIFALYLSTYVLVVTAIDRYQAICQPLTSYSWSPRQAHIMVGAVWIISSFFSIPQIIIFSRQEVSPGVFDCWGYFEPNWGATTYVLWFTISIYIIPLLILILTYGCISCTIWRNFKLKSGDTKRKPQTLGNIRTSVLLARLSKSESKWCNPSQQSSETINPRTHSVKGISKAKIKTIKLTFVVILCYIICWSPFFIAQLWNTFDTKAPFSGPAFTIMLLLVSLNSCTNPWIYIAFSDNLIKQICLCSCHYNRHPINSPQMSMTVSSSDSDQRKYSTNKIEVLSNTMIIGKKLRNGKLHFSSQNKNPKKKRTFNKPVSSISMEHTSTKRKSSIELEETILYSTIEEDLGQEHHDSSTSFKDTNRGLMPEIGFMSTCQETRTTSTERNTKF